ncbi:MAG: HAD family hydrolase [Candidatus Nanoarchaeia archaeon]
MIKAIIFDFWGTLVENGVFPSPLRVAQQMLWLRIPFSDFAARFENAFYTKPFESLSKGFEAVCAEFHKFPKEWLIEKLVGMWNKNRLLAKLFPETISVLDDLKSEYKLALISNTDAFSVEPTLEKFDLAKYFDAIVLSYKIGALKTQPEMFEEVIKQLGVKKEHVVMVGDSIETDMTGAENAGIKGVLVDRRSKREYKYKITDLNGLREILTKIG